MRALLIPLLVGALVVAAVLARRFLQAQIARPLTWIAAVSVAGYVAAATGPWLGAWAIAALDFRVPIEASVEDGSPLELRPDPDAPVRVQIYGGSYLLGEAELSFGAPAERDAPRASAPARSEVGAGGRTGDADSLDRDVAAVSGDIDDDFTELASGDPGIGELFGGGASPGPGPGLTELDLRRATVDPDSSAESLEDERPGEQGPAGAASLGAADRSNSQPVAATVSLETSQARPDSASSPNREAPPAAAPRASARTNPSRDRSAERIRATRASIASRDEADSEVRLRTRASLLAVDEVCRAAELLEGGRTERTLALARVFRERCQRRGS